MKLSVGTPMPIILENPGQRGSTGVYQGRDNEEDFAQIFHQIGFLRPTRAVVTNIVSAPHPQ